MKNNRKILIFSTAYFPYVGGAEVAVKEITDRLPDFEFDLITARFDAKLPQREKIGRVDVYRAGPGWGGFDKFVLPICGLFLGRRLCRQRRYGSIWAIMASQASVAAAFLRRTSGLPLVLTLQEGDEEEHLMRYAGGVGWIYRTLIRPWHTLAIRKADRITAISAYLKKRAEAAGAVAVPRIVPNGVDNLRFMISDLRFKADERKKELGVANDERIIITVSRLVGKNAVDDIIKSLKFFNTPVKLLIAGTGPDEAALKDLCKSEKAEDKVAFLGHVAHDELPGYLKLSDLFVRPSLSEGFGNVFIEAMAAGVPVIATPVGGIVDFLFDPEANPDENPTGLFCRVRDPESIARAAEKYFGNNLLRREIVENAREMARDKYDWKIIAEEMAGVF